MQKKLMLKKTDEFSSVFSFRKRLSTDHIVLHYKPQPLQSYKVGFVVAKKVAKRAVDRNYMRRALRVFCQTQLPIILEQNVKGVHVVIQVRKRFGKKEFLDLNQELALVFNKLKHKL